MKYLLDSVVLYKGAKVMVYDYSHRYKTYTIRYISTGTKEYDVQEYYLKSSE